MATLDFDRFEDYSLEELADELDVTEGLIENCQSRIALARKAMNTFMEQREKLIDIIKLKSQHKGWR